jgi:hypothetical protein
MTKALALVLISSTLALLNGCNQAVTPTSTSNTATQVTPAAPEGPTWSTSTMAANPIDGSVVSIIELRSDSEYDPHHLRLFFRNGKLQTGNHVAVYISVGCCVFTDSDARNMVRLRFDEEKPRAEEWAAADSHDALFPYGHVPSFVAQLLNHKHLAFEFTRHGEAERTTTFSIAGLDEAIRKVGGKL